MIGIVIPYYQKLPGLLNRALRSVAAQEGLHQLRVHVVDDASPVPAEGELAGLDETFAQKIVILRQPNAGPGVARNLALDKMQDDVEFVAFLDSDDIWGKDHLNNASAAFAAGADFYFSDHQREEDAQTRFAQCGYRPDGEPIAGTPSPVHWCQTHALFRAIVLRSPVGTSTVAIRRGKISATRFPTWLRSAGEDSLFWLELLNGGLKAACGTASEVAYGRGVSIFNHRSWGNAAALRTTLDEMMLQIYLRRHFPLDGEMIAQSRAQCRRLDLAFCENLIGCVRRMQWPAAKPAFAYMRRRPWALLRLPPAALRAMWQKLTPPAP
jgi:succinoglycan biosynthesis protein ExoW